MSDRSTAVRSLRKLADRHDPESLSARFRRKRARDLALILASLPQPARVLDLGGDESFWTATGLLSTFPHLELTIANLDDVAVRETRARFVRADARDLAAFRDQQFDLVFSNSVIEHVGGIEEQRAMAAEVRRVGKRYVVQTPNRWFPVEPHFLVPFFAWLPHSWRVTLLTRFHLGWLTRAASREEAEAVVSSIRLLTRREMRELFPDAEIRAERFAGLAKSWIAVRASVPTTSP